MIGKTWDPPRYKYASKLPFASSEAELDALISGCGPKTSTFLQLLKETAIRAGEAHRLGWIDIDFELGTVRVTPEKGNKPRIFKLSNKLLKMLSKLKSKNNSNRIFSKHLRTPEKAFPEAEGYSCKKTSKSSTATNSLSHVQTLESNHALSPDQRRPVRHAIPRPQKYQEHFDLRSTWRSPFQKRG